jgi:putative hydrolase of the HAD superfamily
MTALAARLVGAAQGQRSTAQASVEAVWTDFGGVLTPPAEDSMVAFCAKVGIATHVLRSAVTAVAAYYGQRDPMAPLDIPLVSEHAWARQVERVLARDFAIEVDLGSPGEMWFADRPVNLEWLSYLDRLRADGIFVGLLSNMVPAWNRHWQRLVPQDFFDGVVLSYEVGFRKPAPAIFAHAAAVAGVRADACVLIDDLTVNCAGAESAGWRAIEFTGTAHAIGRLASWTGTRQGGHPDREKGSAP